MNTPSKTAEKVKQYIDQVDARIQKFDREIHEVIQKYQKRYHQELGDLNMHVHETKMQVQAKREDSLQQIKDAYQSMKEEAQSLSELHLELLKQRMVETRAESISYSDELERKLQDVKLEVQERFKKTKMAINNFKGTFNAS